MRTIVTTLLLLLAITTSNAKADNTSKNAWQRLSETDGAYVLIPGFLETELDTSKKMMERQEHVTDKAIVLLKARQDGKLEPYRLYIGGRFAGSHIVERTNTDGKFPILSRLPNQHVSGKKDSYSVANDVTVHATATAPWITGFIQGEYTEVEYPGQDDKQIRKYFVTVGDLEKFPLYVTIGKKSVNFGNFASYAPITHTHSAHYFWAQTDEPLLEVGFVKDGTMIAASLIKNDRGLRVLNSPSNDDKYENFAVNASQTFTLDKDGRQTVKIGAGFLRGSIYDSALAHHPPAIGFNDRDWNELVNANIEITMHAVDLMAEYTQTIEEWPATDDHVRALTVQGRYNDTIAGRPAKYTLAYSRGEQGEHGDKWHKMEQGIAGIEWDILPHLSIGAEYMVNADFVPLILPTITADDGVVSHTGIAAVKLSF